MQPNVHKSRKRIDWARFQATNIRGSQLQNKEISTFPVCCFWRLIFWLTPVSGGHCLSITPRQHGAWLWYKSRESTLARNRTFVLLCLLLLENHNFLVPRALSGLCLGILPQWQMDTRVSRYDTVYGVGVVNPSWDCACSSLSWISVSLPLAF